jgi:hypothetical protein
LKYRAGAVDPRTLDAWDDASKRGDDEMPLDLDSIREDLAEFDGVVANIKALSRSCGPLDPKVLVPIVGRAETLLQTIDDALPQRVASVD